MSARPVIAQAAESLRDRLPTTVLMGTGFVLALVIAVRGWPETLYDDAAITFRYAQRIADGAGFTFNDGDRTNGASAPLYTLVLAGLARTGLRPESGAMLVGALAYGSTAALGGALAARAAGRAAGALAVALILTSSVFLVQATSGMESALAAALGLAALVAFSSRRTVVCGLLLGLAVLNRLDALALVVTVMAAFAWADRRRLPHVLGVAGLVVAPWIVWSWIYFGSPIPHSATQKLSGATAETTLDPTWVLHAVTGREGIVVLLAALALPALWVKDAGGVAGLVRSGRRDPAMVAVCAGLLWVMLHAVAYSLIDLGAPYPWYTTVIVPVLCVVAACAVGRLLRGAGGITRAPSLGLVLVLTLTLSRAPSVVAVAGTVLHGPEPRATRELDATRRAAGRYLDRNAQRGEVVRTCFGWVAYEAIDQPIDEVCPLSTRVPVADPTWFVESPGPGEPLVAPAGAEQVAEFVAPEVDGIAGRTVVYRRD